MLNIPNEAVLAQILKLLDHLARELSSVLTKRLKLVDELDNHIPQPRGRKLILNHTILFEGVEQVAVGRSSIETLRKRWLHLREQVSEVQFLVQQQEGFTAINKRTYGIRRWPSGGLEVVIADIVECTFVQLI